jgi:hypothetical protein
MFVKINKEKHYLFYLPISQNPESYKDSNKPPKQKKNKQLVMFINIKKAKKFFFTDQSHVQRLEKIA